MARKKTSADTKISLPLIVEQHPQDYSGLPFLTLIQYRKVPMLTVVDTIDVGVVRAYVLDLCGAEAVDEGVIISAASAWYDNHRNEYPISIDFSKNNLTHITSKIYRSLNVEFISRVIGPVPSYQLRTVDSIKRRRRRTISPAVEVHAAILQEAL